MPYLDLEEFERILYPQIEDHFPIIDLRKYSWIYPDGAMAVFLLLKHYINKGVKPKVFRPINIDVDSYFERTGIPIMTQEDVIYEPDIQEIIMRSWTSRETIQAITEIKNMSNVATLVGKFEAIVGKQFKDKNIASKLGSAILETFQNIPDHANPSNTNGEGYANLQSYQDGSRICIAAGDLGVGIRDSLTTSTKYRDLELDDISAIKKVVEEETSRDHGEDNVRGSGLMRVVNNIKALSGIIIIRSGKGALKIGPFWVKREYDNLFFFPGNQVSLRITKL